MVYLSQTVSWTCPAPQPETASPAQRGRSCCLVKDTMSLSGLLSVIADAPALRRALDQADGVAADFVAPPPLRPFLAATLAAPPPPARPPGDAPRGSSAR